MITVIFATHNGAATLPRMLDRLRQLQSPGAFEILAVDNASSDATAEILHRYAAHLPLQVFSCSRRGKNIAVNSVIERARGELVVLTDDDVLPEPQWLLEFQELARQQPQHAVFGGRVVPDWPGVPPPWILENVDLELAFSLHQKKVPEGDEDPERIWGPNMMVRAELFRDPHRLRFSERMGPASGEYAMGGETEFVVRAAALGHRVYFSHRPVVRHMIPESHLDRDWLLARSRRMGRFLCRRNPDRLKTMPLLAGWPRWRVRLWVQDYIESVLKGAWFGTDASFAACARVEEHRGYFREFKEWQARSFAPPPVPGDVGSTRV